MRFGQKPPPLPPPLPVAPRPELTPAEWEELRRARELLENPGLTARLANSLGRPLEKGIELLPDRVRKTVHRTTRAALNNALSLAVISLNPSRLGKASDRMHQILVGASGGVGGAFGLAALPVELPVSTTIMLRSIADIARSEGHDLRHLPIRLACLEVFALGGRAPEDDATESSYWAVRAALAKTLSEAVGYITEKGVIEHTAPPILRLVTTIASRFGVVVSEQIAAKAVPIVGAAGGSIVNVLFMNHFQDMARGHFIVKRLENRHGREFIRECYESLPLRLHGA